MDNTEQHRHRCEVRHLLAMCDKRGVNWLKAYYAGWKRWDGKLCDDTRAQWSAGNRGAFGDWRE
jgi:hypothetical protein